MEKEFTKSDVIIIGLHMFVLGITLFRIIGDSGGHSSTVVALASFNVLMAKISSWFAIAWMIALVGIAIYIYMKNRKSGMTVIGSLKRYTWAYLLLEIPIMITYQLAINVRM